MEFHQEQEQEEEEQGEIMALPISSTYGHGQMIHHDSAAQHNHIVPLSDHHHHHHQPPVTDGCTITAPPPSSSSMEDTVPYTKKMVMVVRYRECLKNHAAAMGAKATDGCGEFMPSGDEGTLEALTCSACSCHRNFHRKEIEGDPYHPIPTTSYDCNYLSTPPHLKRFELGNGRKLIQLQGHHHHPKGVLGTESFGYNHNNAGALVPSRGPPPMIMSYNMGMGSFPSESDDQEDGGGGFMSRHPLPQPQPQPQAAPPHPAVHKRFRTKFTQEQKLKMVSFAEKLGWKMQKQEEAVVQQFCQELGIKRRVFKVWMHNNKHILAKNTNSVAINPPQDPN